jgi:hypothetical protein
MRAQIRGPARDVVYFYKTFLMGSSNYFPLFTVGEGRLVETA